MWSYHRATFHFSEEKKIFKYFSSDQSFFGTKGTIGNAQTWMKEVRISNSTKGEKIGWVGAWGGSGELQKIKFVELVGMGTSKKMGGLTEQAQPTQLKQCLFINVCYFY